MAFSKSLPITENKIKNGPVICWVNLRVIFVNWSSSGTLQVDGNDSGGAQGSNAHKLGVARCY